MATYLENLTARRDAIAAELAAIDATKPGGGINSIAGDVDHDKYKASLYKELADLEARIDKAQANSDGPIEIISQGIT
jgi:hypothetical protein